MRSRPWLLARTAAAQPEICQLVVAELRTQLRESILDVLSSAGALRQAEPYAASAGLRRACGLVAHMLLASAQTRSCVTSMLCILVPELGQVLARVLARAVLSGVLMLVSGGEVDEVGLSAEQRQHETGPTYAHVDIGDGATQAHMLAAREVLASTPLSCFLPAL
jgi:hypothetical protein